MTSNPKCVEVRIEGVPVTGMIKGSVMSQNHQQNLKVGVVT